MKKIHGTYSIQPETITNQVVAPDAGISESKLNLTYGTQALHDAIGSTVLSSEAHEANTINPHSKNLTQENISGLKKITTHTDGLSITGRVTHQNDVTMAQNLKVLGSATGNIYAVNSDKLANMLPSGTNNSDANSLVRTDATGTVTLSKAKANMGNINSSPFILGVSGNDNATIGKVPINNLRDEVFSAKTYGGENTFNGYDGRLITLPSEFTAYIVTVTAVASDGTVPTNVGSISVAKQGNSFVVYNTGTFRGSFNFIVMAV